MGTNYYGQLGDGTFNMTNRPEQIMAANVTAIAAGQDYSLFLKSDGSLWGMGDNTYGQLGGGAQNSTNRPKLIVSGGVTTISAGGGNCLFITNNGSLWVTGLNNNGQLGDGTSNFSTNHPELIVSNTNFNNIFVRLLNSGDLSLSLFGFAGTNYALDRSFSLSPPAWIPQATNPANSFGALIFTNTPNPAMNNFWRIRSVP
jgi:alpha-tubulin suppressor-like RCC1 family protein